MTILTGRNRTKYGNLDETIPILSRRAFSGRCRRIIMIPTLTVLTQILALAYSTTTTKVHAFQSINVPQRRSLPTMTYSDNAKNIPKNYKKRPSKSKQEIQTVLRHQFSELKKIHHSHAQHDQNRATSTSASASASQLDYSELSTLESNIYNSIWASRNVRDVQYILSEFINTAKEIIHQAAPHLPQTSSQSDDMDYIQLIGPNIATAALRRVIDLRPDFKRKQLQKDDEDVRLAKLLIPQLLQVVGREVVHSESEKNVEHMDTNNPYIFTTFLLSMRIITGSSSKLLTTGMTPVSNANLLHSLSRIRVLQKKNGKYNDESTLTPLARKICTNIHESQQQIEDSSSNFVKRVNPVLLVEALRSLATFKIKDESLLRQIGNRLKQGDATGKLSSEQLSQGLWAYASLQRPHLGVLKSFTRRLRKANVRRELSGADTCRAIWSVGQSMKQLDLIVQYSGDADAETSFNGELFADEEIASLREDLAVMLYTLSGELLRPKSVNTQMKKIHGLGLSQVTDLLSTFVIFEFDSDHEIIKELADYMKEKIDSHPNEFTTSRISHILWAFHRLRASEALDQETLESLVGKFSDQLSTANGEACTPKTLNTLVRSVVMMLPDHGASMHKLHHILSNRINDEGFLEQCNEFECSNLMWCLSMAQRYDKELMKLISNRMQNEDIISALTPSSASRFLWSFTSLVENNAEDLEMKEMLFENFQLLGGILLSAQLTPVDSSSAMWAMAKSSYSLDMGIFDHLAEVLAVDFMLERASMQQITTALWSCGKMISWEDPLREKIEFGEFTAPPYVQNAERFASYLATCNDLMSPKDMSQTIWAIGRLKINDFQILEPLVNTATEMARTEKFNSQEIANIIWALSKVDFDDEHAISNFTQQIQRPVLLNKMTSQEAANILYALGKLRIRDESTFKSMNAVLMRELDTATSQTIANALWAHDNVDLQPPRQLFDSWAKEKLDIVGLYLDNQQVEIIENSQNEE